MATSDAPPAATAGAAVTPKITAAEVRDRFIQFFVEKEHTHWPSSSSVPHNDPTLLFANAGMNQYKPVFLNTCDPNSDMAKLKRATNSQKCIRAGGKHNDLDDVGKDVYHHTFFEMLGSWSFGDYFKQEAIEWAWELLTVEFGIDGSRLYATYFEGDESLGLKADTESRDLWLKVLPESHVLPGNTKDNFWEMGATGPCGPCSELHYDRIGGGRDAAHLVNMDDPDVLEVWNLVFMQFNKKKSGKLVPLAAQHVDTGAGLERLVSVLQDVRSNYDTDLFQPIFQRIQELSGKPAYTGLVGDDDKDGIDTAYRVVADHMRTLCIAIADGGTPSPEGSGSVLRLIFKRALRFSHDHFTTDKRFLEALVPVVTENLGAFWTSVPGKQSEIVAILNEEEDQFLTTMAKGEREFKKAVSGTAAGGVIDGKTAWRLYETFGYPVELTSLMAEKLKMTVDMDGYTAAKAHAKTISQAGDGGDAATSIKLDVTSIGELKELGVGPTDDEPKYKYERSESGEYTFHDHEAKVVAIRLEKEFTDSADGGADPDAGIACGVVLDSTNFYAEQGGQIFDTGTIKSASAQLDVTNVQKYGQYVLHTGTLSGGALAVGDTVSLSFDHARRRPIMSNHTATHVLNYALRKVLGAADQKGSLVDHERLRFDFTCKKQLKPEQIRSVEQAVAEVVAGSQQVSIKVSELARAKAVQGLRAMFGETYPDPVRVVSVGAEVDSLLDDPTSGVALDRSVEFCGGTHVINSKDIGPFVIVGEDAITKGVRRMVALTGEAAVEAALKAEALREKIALCSTKSEFSQLDEEVAKAPVPKFLAHSIRQEIDTHIQKFVEEEKKKKAAMAGLANARAQEIIAAGDAPALIVEKLECGANAKALSGALQLLNKGVAANSVVMFFGADDDKVACSCKVPADLSKKLSAGKWVQAVAKIIGGKGGGKPTQAQCSGSDPSKIDEAVEAAKKFAQELMQ